MVATMRFCKMHGIGNDFVMLRDTGVQQRDWADLSVKMCDRHFGVGADGIILALPSKRADVRMRMFNPDGSEAEMCGNGIRCLAKYAYESGLVTAQEMSIETAAGIKTAALTVQNGIVTAITVSMGLPRLEPAEIPVEATGTPVIDLPLVIDGLTLNVTCVSMGNPHAVAFVDDDVKLFPLTSVGPVAEHHQAFPKRVNLEVCQLVAPDHLRVRVWERGAGITLACGTGACASAVAARLKGLVGNQCIVELPGGTLNIGWDGVGEVLMTGPATTVFEGAWLLG